MDPNQKRTQIALVLEYLHNARMEMQGAPPGDDDEIIAALDAAIDQVEKRFKLLDRMKRARRVEDWPSQTEWRAAGGKLLEYPLPPSTLR